MVKTEKKQWSYLFMLGLSIAVFILGWKLNLIRLDPPATGTEAEFRDDYQEFSALDWLKGLVGLQDPVQDTPTAKREAEAEDGDTGSKNELKNGTEDTQNTMGNNTHNDLTTVSGNMLSVSENDIKGEKEREMFTADPSYFDDALFIGDSRTVGLSEYGELGQAEVLADSGMSVYKILKTEFSTKSGEKMTLEQLLEKRTFGKIYLMLGINELGYDFDQTVKKYQEVVDMIRRMQPEAIIFVEANLHITGEKSESSSHYNNENINRFNQAVARMADGVSIFYLDVNPLFDDENGNLSQEYTTDHTHILGKYYRTWVEWLLTQAR